jgi:hypothetical protein
MNKTIWGCALAMALTTIGCSSTSDGNPGAAGSAGSPASAGNGGSLASGGSAGSSGTGDTDLCNAQYDAMVANCGAPESSRQGNVLACQDAERDFQGIGCKSQYDSWLLCTTKPGYDCTTDTGCETSQGSYFTCESQSVVRTGCVRLSSSDAIECTDASKPYAFSCLSAAPTQCQQVVTQGAGIWCCPQL